MKIPYLGKIQLHWCHSCYVPLIRSKCSICGQLGIKVSLTPPGDIRPAFSNDLERIISVIETQFGEYSANKFEKLVKNQIILLNKVPYIDRMDEIVIQGQTIGLFRFNVVKEDFEFIPKLSLAKEIWSSNSKGYLIADSGAKKPILNGASVLSPGVLDSDPNINPNDPVIIVCEGKVIAVGLAKMKGEQMGKNHKGIAVKVKYRKDESLNLSMYQNITWERIIEANKESLEILEAEAIHFIEKIAKKYTKHTVAYSGGKDSLVTLDLVAQSKIQYDIIFSDTGLEYPETLENIHLVSQKYKKQVFKSENDSWDFWERFKQFGPPSRNSRWCCKSAKLFPVNEILTKHYPNEKEILSYIGRRRYESLGRSKESRVSKNPWIPKQISASPINNWTAFEVFLYIKRHNLFQLLNPLYHKMEFIRVGCWVCPASSLSDFKIMEKTHPSLIVKLKKSLNVIREKNNLPKQYISWGLWRWKNLPQKMLDLLKNEGINFKFSNSYMNDAELKFRMTDSISPCVQGGYSTFLSANQMLELERIQRLIPIFGSFEYNEDLDILILETRNKIRADIFRDGSIIIKGKNELIVTKAIESIVKTLHRIVHCDGCGICTYNCKNDALNVENGVISVKVDRCTFCLNCNEYCTLLKYKDYESYFLI